MSDTHKIEGTHELVVVDGPDARKFLNNLLSQDLGQMQPDRAVRSFLLGPKGKLRALLWVFGVDGRFRVGHDSRPGLNPRLVIGHHDGAETDGRVDVSGEVDVSDRPGVRPPRHRFEFVDDLHRGNLWRA